MKLVNQIESALEFAYLAKMYAEQSDELKAKSLDCEKRSKQILSEIKLDQSETESSTIKESIPVFDIKYPKVREVSTTDKTGTANTTLEYALNPFGTPHV